MNTNRSLVIALLASAVTHGCHAPEASRDAQVEARDDASRKELHHVAKVEPGSAREWGELSTAPRVEIDALEKLWRMIARRSDMLDCSASAFGRIVVNAGANFGRTGDDLLVGCLQDFIEETVQIVDGNPRAEPILGGGGGRNFSEQQVHCATSLRDPGTQQVQGVLVGYGGFTGIGCAAKGGVRLMSGGRTAWVASPWPSNPFDGGDDFGVALADVGDIDGDGRSDAAVGGPASPKQVTLLSGADGAVLHFLSGYEPSFGAALAGGRDFDADAVPDFLVGAPGGAGAGCVRLFSGATRELLAKLDAPTESVNFGQTLAVVDDCNGDGVAEIVSGDPGAGAGAFGCVHLYSGADRRPLHTWRGERANAHFGRAFSSADDLDGDGIRDFVVGAPGVGGNGPMGAVYVLSPRTGGVLLRIDGEPRTTENDLGFDAAQGRRSYPSCHSFGWAIATGDFNGDGIADLAIGSPQAGPNNLVGVVYAISGVELRKHMAR